LSKSRLTPEQRKKQKEALDEFHKQRKEDRAAGLVPPRSDKGIPKITSTLLKKLKALQDSAIENIEASILGHYKKTLDGKEITVDKTSLDNSRWLLQQVTALEKAELDAKTQALKYQIEIKKAMEAGAIAKEDPIEKAREAAAKGEHISLASQITSYDPDWDEEEEFVYENDPEE
jgi:hypothetical protein